jgi:hypothetical protein
MDFEIHDVMYNDIDALGAEATAIICCYPSIKQSSCTGTASFDHRAL